MVLITSNQKTIVLETIQTIGTQSSKELVAYQKYDNKSIDHEGHG